MLIDWFTVDAQALNFLILVWLLKRFLYQPVLDAIDAREARIAKQIADAQDTQRNAEHQKQEFQGKTKELDEQRAALLAQAQASAAAEHERLLVAARKAADELAAKRREALNAQALQLDQDLSERARKEVFEIARKVLRELASADLQERIVEIFVARIQALEGPERVGLTAALGTSIQPALIRSAFDLPKLQQEAIQAAVSKTLGDNTQLRFQGADALVCGIELVAGGQKLSWNIEQYLGALEHMVRDLVAPAQGAAK